MKHQQLEEILAGFQKQFAIMRKQPALIAAQLHRGSRGAAGS
jgi:hypothetical protein